MPEKIDTCARLGAVILAGGLARRMGGRDKGLVELNQRPMVSWVLNAIAPVASDVVINANRNIEDYLLQGVDVIGDTVSEFPGPLAGLLSALEHLENEWVLMCPCDSPFVTPELFNTLWQSAIQTSSSIVVAHDGKRLQPVFSIVKRNLQPSLKAYLARGDRKIDLWYEQEGFESVDCAPFSALFHNINTTEERNAAEQQLSN